MYLYLYLYVLLLSVLSSGFSPLNYSLVETVLYVSHRVMCVRAQTHTSGVARPQVQSKLSERSDKKEREVREIKCKNVKGHIKSTPLLPVSPPTPHLTSPRPPSIGSLSSLVLILVRELFFYSDRKRDGCCAV